MNHCFLAVTFFSWLGTSWLRNTFALGWGGAQEKRPAGTYLAGIVQVCVVPTTPCVSGTQHVAGDGPVKQVLGSAAAGWVQPDVSLLQPLGKERRS